MKYSYACTDLHSGYFWGLALGSPIEVAVRSMDLDIGGQQHVDSHDYDEVRACPSNGYALWALVDADELAKVASAVADDDIEAILGRPCDTYVEVAAKPDTD